MAPDLVIATATNHSLGYSLLRSPYLTPALELGAAVPDFSATLQKWGLPIKLTSAVDISALMNASTKYLEISRGSGNIIGCYGIAGRFSTIVGGSAAAGFDKAASQTSVTLILWQVGGSELSMSSTCRCTRNGARSLRMHRRTSRTAPSTPSWMITVETSTYNDCRQLGEASLDDTVTGPPEIASPSRQEPS